MKSTSFFILFCLLTFSLYGQEKSLSGYYGSNDLTVRAGNGFIEENRLKKFDFQKTGFKKIVLIYWPAEADRSSNVRFAQEMQDENLENALLKQNQEYIRQQFESIRGVEFTVLEAPQKIDRYFRPRPVGSTVRVSPEGEVFLKKIKGQGYDGVFLIFEDKFQDLIGGSSAWLPAKGLYQTRKKELAYYGLYSTLLDLDSFQPVKNIGYKQLSADRLPATFDEGAVTSADSQAALQEVLAQRFKTNIEEIKRIHKLF